MQNERNTSPLLEEDLNKRGPQTKDINGRLDAWCINAYSPKSLTGDHIYHSLRHYDNYHNHIGDKTYDLSAATPTTPTIP